MSSSRNNNLFVKFEMYSHIVKEESLSVFLIQRGAQ